VRIGFLRIATNGLQIPQVGEVNNFKTIQR
jgi:hypothetical protein